MNSEYTSMASVQGAIAVVAEAIGVSGQVLSACDEFYNSAKSPSKDALVVAIDGVSRLKRVLQHARAVLEQGPDNLGIENVTNVEESTKACETILKANAMLLGIQLNGDLGPDIVKGGLREKFHWLGKSED